ncbi:MAG: cob(I)yrinic acid a,c-diamide adenosyltransferase [Lachnospiraceae bacterium]|nr:cob(I)yrinic acid a,c-diamide adenosyltransferase [Lachnospiraceae bacterium]
MEKGSIQIYYGEGRGKSSAALGNAIRSAGDGKSAYVVQFMKGQLNSEFLKRLEPEVKVFRFERCAEGFDAMSEEEKQEQKMNIQNGLNFAKKALVTGECDLLVLDEVLGLVEEGMSTVEQIVEILRAKSLYTDVILTGRNCPEQIYQMADSVLNIVPEKTE